MSTTGLPPSFVAQALALPEPQRAALAEQLLASLEPPANSLPKDYVAEVVRRCNELDAGTVKTYSGEETIQYLRDAIAKESDS